ncbi:MAG TPA: hypothetical protein VKF60_04005 [Myxococcota bacterium]|nr:hypothetical protein [Myxococcota bacterium]
MGTDARLLVLLAAALAPALFGAPSRGAEIRYDFQGYVQPSPGGPSLPPSAAGGSLTPLSTFSGYFSYVQENATLLAGGGQSAYYEFTPAGSQVLVTNGIETFATSSNFSMNLSTYFFIWDVQASTALTVPLGPNDFMVDIQFNATPFPPGFPDDPIPAVPGANATLAEFQDVIIQLEVPSPFGSSVPFSIPLLLTSLQGHVVPEVSVAAATCWALVAVGLLRLRRRRT